MIFLIFFAFVAFPERTDAILANTKKEDIEIKVSSSIGIFHFEDNKCFQTNGTETLLSNENMEWCSNKGTEQSKPFIQYSIKGESMKIKDFSVRNGCCYYFSNCLDDNTKLNKKGSCCRLYSYSLLGSDDERTWITLHKEKEDNSFYVCKTKTFHVDKETKPYKYLRFTLDSEYPGCSFLMQLNQVEFYGEKVGKQESKFEIDENDDEDESISIIGKVKNDE